MTAYDLGTRAKFFMSDSKVFPDEASMQFRQNYLKFYQFYQLFLHHEKRNSSGSMSAISNLGAAVTKVCHFPP